MGKQLKITETVLRDANQSQIATRLERADFADILETMDADDAVAVGHHHLIDVREAFPVALFGGEVSFVTARMGQVVASEDHVLGRGRDRRSVLRCQNIVD